MPPSPPPSRESLGTIAAPSKRPRVSFAHRAARPTYVSEESEQPVQTTSSNTPNVDTALIASPLPKLPLIVLSITMLGEFLSANVSTPFLLFMVEGFGKFRDEADIAYWTGVLVSVFFITQFLTSLLWATIAKRHGQRTVLFTSLAGSAITCAMFGTSTTLEEAVAIRLLQGVFAGAVGVARGTVTLITDPTNEGRAYAILGFCWGLGGVAGAIIGGSFESPAKKWPSTFPMSSLFARFPYLLPCMLAASITLTGALLSLFLGYDGGPRTGRIFLLSDAKEPQMEQTYNPGPSENVFQRVLRRLSTRVQTIFRRAPQVAVDSEAVRPSSPDVTSSTSQAIGSSYDFRPRLDSRSSAIRRGSLATTDRRRRHLSIIDDRENSHDDLNLAQRMLLANEFSVSSMADLWVNAAITVDEDPFVSDSDDESSHSDLTSIPNRENDPISKSLRSSVFSRAKLGRSRTGSQRPSASFHKRPSFLGFPSRRSSGISLPSIYNNTGVRTPPDHKATIDDPTVVEMLPSVQEVELTGEISLETAKASASLWSQLPLTIILQYGFLALHSTTHDQIFLSYLVSTYDTGGLGLNAAHFAQLIALMCLAQIAYQFYLYPNLGPPRGRFSHLAMFRLGSVLFVPSYLTVTLYRVFASPDQNGNTLVMALLSISTAVRYCGSTFAYTAVSILLNYMSPPEVNGLANGIAQSIVSLARFVGPVLGGYLWSMSVEGGASGYYLGFLAVSIVACLAIAHSFMIR